VKDQTIVQYVGFKVNSSLREYFFAVHEKGTEPLQYSLTIADEAFLSHRVRYQDAPNICSLRLHRELEAHADHRFESTYSVTETELAIYHDTRKPKAKGTFQKRQSD
jgi:hypothetical protein